MLEPLSASMLEVPYGLAAVVGALGGCGSGLWGLFSAASSCLIDSVRRLSLFCSCCRLRKSSGWGLLMPGLGMMASLLFASRWAVVG